MTTAPAPSAAVARRRFERKRVGDRRAGPFTYVALVVTTIVAILPLYWTVVQAKSGMLDW